MDREVLFRGKRVDNGKWVYGYYCRYGYTGKAKKYIIPHYASDLYAFEVIPETIGQFTGLADKNGQMIFEGDIAMYDDDFCEIVYRNDDAMFYAKFDNVLESFGNIAGSWLDVIGNIHDEGAQ